ncbi:hypothetical protein [Rubrivivax rivuli]|uniref:hypothetical protein n=1 Tax=Rubrivivax rivuli TaxID=1862385 RepID=UPI0013E2AB40|nr:hypothetical protein [Rubrivivax rivuli]
MSTTASPIEAIAAEVARILTALLAGADEDAKTHRFTPLTDAELAVRRPRALQAKASAELEGVLPTVAGEGLEEAFFKQRWDGERCCRYIIQSAQKGVLPSANRE